jgi:MFS superfamily sulfate permease-like transporter
MPVIPLPSSADAVVTPVSPRTIEKPLNGLAGLKHWRHDMAAGLVVSLISLPFSLGIAVASGAPPICGIISAIIAGFVLPFLGGSYVTISGPAAGLAPILLASMMALGRGDLKVGYPLLLVTIFFAGCAQLVLAKSKMARFSAIFPAAVIEGMLCAIGLLIIVKQFPYLLGVKFHAHEFYEYLVELPTHVMEMQPAVFLIGMLSLVVMFALSACTARWLKVVPPQVIAVVVGSILGLIFGLQGDALIFIPANPLSHGFEMPDFRGLWSDSGLWMAAVTTVVTLTLVDGIESLATVMAVDKIDPFHRKSDPNRTLMAMGVSNIVSSLAGGLTIIPGGVKSTACIMGGGRTQWANFYNACFLLCYLLLARNLINLMPYSVLAAMLIFTGYKLCGPKVWKHVAHIGGEQLAIFTITVIATLATDLLWGIVTGIAAKFILATWLHSSSVASSSAAFSPAVSSSSEGTPETNGHARQLPPGDSWLARLTQPLRSPVAKSYTEKSVHHIDFTGPIVSFNLLHVTRELAKVPASANRVCLHFTEGVTLVDHTACESLHHFQEECQRSGRAQVELDGLDDMRPRSAFPSSMRLRDRTRRAPSPLAPDFAGRRNSAYSTAASDAASMAANEEPSVDVAVVGEYPQEGQPPRFDLWSATVGPADSSASLSHFSLVAESNRGTARPGCGR